MSGKVTGWLLRHPDGPDELAYRMVLVAMADLADNDAGNIRGASRYVAELARVSVRYARALIDRAIADEWLEVTRPGDRRRPTVYRFRAEPIAHNGPDGPEVMRGLEARITPPADEVMRGASAQTCAPRERAQSAPLERASTVLRSNGFSDGPAPDPKGVRSVAEATPPVAPEADVVGRTEALRAARRALAAACPRCDEHGWIAQGDTSGEWCDHKPRPADRRRPIAVDEAAMPGPDPPAEDEP